MAEQPSTQPAPAAAPVPVPTPKKPSDAVLLSDGEALEWIAAQESIRARDVAVVVLAGAADSGKTTILTSLYELFQEAPVAGWSFVGSESLVGFERRAFVHRLDSTNTEGPPRTPISNGFRFLHLRTFKRSESRASELLLSDISGEFFQAAADSTEACKRLTFVPFARTLVLVLDGARVRRQDTKYRAFADVRMVAKGLLTAGMVTPGSEILLVLSKLDLLADERGDLQTIEGLDVIQRQIRDLAKQHNVGFRFMSVAAQPRSKLLPFAHGVPLLLGAWTASTALPATQPLVVLKQPGSRRAWSLTAQSWFGSQETGGHDETI